MGSVVGKDRVDLVRDGLDQPTAVASRRETVSRSSTKGELRSPDDGDKEIELALREFGPLPMWYR